MSAEKPLCKSERCAILERMSEYISLEPEYTLDPDLVILHTNLDLAPDGAERYASRAEGEEGSPLAQFLFQIEGLAALELDGTRLIVRRQPNVEWHTLLDEITDALKEFFL
ncbi:MAG: NifU N-terminal domain-containing protein [Anaerolineae bacterium]|nr:NifU N-terminal domain-containing protein [Anaerolineae bacterium]MDW8300648.1 NifU N-terminal domain-containing protein [Anaerolineae bacterium]